MRSLWHLLWRSLWTPFACHECRFARSASLGSAEISLFSAKDIFISLQRQLRVSFILAARLTLETPLQNADGPGLSRGPAEHSDAR